MKNDLLKYAGRFCCLICFTSIVLYDRTPEGESYLWTKMPNLNAALSYMRRRRETAKRWQASEEEKTERGKSERFFVRSADGPLSGKGKVMERLKIPSDDVRGDFNRVIHRDVAERVGFEPTWAVNPNAFRVRPVMTTSIPLHILLLRTTFALCFNYCSFLFARFFCLWAALANVPTSIPFRII